MTRVRIPALIFLSLALLGLLFTSVAASPPPKPQLVTFPNPGPDVLAEMAAQGWDIWEVTPDQVTAQVIPAQISSLQTYGVDLTSVKVQASYAPRFPACYRTFDTATQQMQDWATDYPDLVDLIDAGPTWETEQEEADRRLWTLRITNENNLEPKPKFFLVALHHAREIATPEVALKLADLLLTQYGKDAEITWLVDNREIWIMPFANPDGHIKAESLEDWRKNTRTVNSEGEPLCQHGSPPNSYGVDLNRNYDYEWGKVGSSPIPCNLTYRGEAGFSEPETQAIRDLVQAEDFDLLISLHSYGDLVLYAWGWTYDPAPDDVDLRAIAAGIASFNNYTDEQSSDLYPTSGDTCDWAYGAEDTPCLTFEIGSWDEGYFWPDCATMEEQWQENRDALLYTIKLAGNPYGMAHAPIVRSIQLQNRGRWLTVNALLDREADSPEPPAGEVFIDQIGIPLTGILLSPEDNVLNSAVETMTATVDLSGIEDQHALYVVGLDDDGEHGPPNALYFQPCLDLTGDHTINADDVMQVAALWHQKAGDLEFDSALDLNGNAQIDVQDVSRITAQWGTSCTTWKQKG